MTIPHLDDEALSAAADGEATAAEEAHLSGCAQCRAELEALAAVARVVGAPVAPPPRATVDAAIARALGAFSTDLSAGAGAHDVRQESAMSADGADGAGPLDMQRAIAAPTRQQPVPRLAARPARLRDRAPRWALSAVGVAAAAVVVVGIVAVAGRLGGGHASVSTSAPGSFSTSLAPRVAAGGPSASSTTISPIPGDLGNQTDATVVAGLVREAVHVVDNALNPAPASTARGPLAAPAIASCAAEAQRALRTAPASAGGTVEVRYSATLRWRGQPAVVVVFSRPGGLSGVILNSADCSVLVVLPL